MSAGATRLSFDQLSGREKALVVGLSLVAVLAVVGVAWLWAHGLVGELEEETTLNRERLAEIEIEARLFLETKAKCDDVQRFLTQNEIASLRVPINNVARTITLEGGGNLSDKIGSLDKQMETPIGGVCERKSKKAAKKKKKKPGEQEEAEVVRIEQDIELKAIPMGALFDFLEGIEKSQSLLLITSLDIKRKFGEPDTAQSATVRVATFKSATSKSKAAP